MAFIAMVSYNEAVERQQVTLFGYLHGAQNGLNGDNIARSIVTRARG